MCDVGLGTALLRNPFIEYNGGDQAAYLPIQNSLNKASSTPSL
jgi:hypothetical protein